MKSRFFIAAVIFLALTGTKLFFPERAAYMRERILPAVTRETGLREDLIHIGKAFAGQESSILVWRRLTGLTEEDGFPLSPAQASEEGPPAPLPASAESFVLSEMVQSNLLSLAPLISISQEQALEAGQPADEPDEPLSLFLAPDTLAPEYAPTPAQLMQEKVGRFLEAQAVFAEAEYEQPASVSYEAPIPGFEYSSPCAMPITSSFGYRHHPIEDKVKFHYGTDLGAHEGCELYAFADATVLSVSELDGYGLTLLLDHGEGFQTLYAHCSSLLVSQGDKVNRGDKVALAGQTGKVTGPHLHFEVLYNGKYLNPEFYIS